MHSTFLSDRRFRCTYTDINPGTETERSLFLVGTWFSEYLVKDSVRLASRDSVLSIFQERK